MNIEDKVVPAPNKPEHLPENIYWLAGEAFGSWFHIKYFGADFVITRYNLDGKIECKGIFQQTEGERIDLNKKLEMSYLSHCAEINIVQSNGVKKFKVIEKC